MTLVQFVQSGAGFDAAGRFHQPARIFEMPQRESEDSPSRGALSGLAISLALWVGIVFLARGLWRIL